MLKYLNLIDVWKIFVKVYAKFVNCVECINIDISL